MSEAGQVGESLRDRRVLVTGGAGFIGSHLVKRLAAVGGRVVVLDDLSTGLESNLAGLAGSVEFVRGSILDSGLLSRAVEGCDAVFHEAAMVSVPQSVEQPEECLRINVEGTQGLLQAARRAGVRRVVFAASAAAYGNAPTLPSREDQPPDCWSPYAMSKVAGEHLLATFARCYGMSTVSLRYFNIFGPRQRPDSAYAAAISAFYKALSGGERPTVFGDGKQTRDFTYVGNVVDANLLAATSTKDLRGEVFNIGTGRRISLLEVIQTMAGVMGVRGERAEPKIAPARAGDVRDSVADIGRAREVLGYEPRVGLEEGLRRLVEAARG